MRFNLSLSKDWKTILIIVCLGFFSRAIALIFSSPTDFDAVERVYIAWRWLENPEIITHGVWLPLHNYLIAGVMWFFQDQKFPPIALNIVFSVATAVPLYFFTKNEFGEKYSWFVGCAFLFYPLAFNNSLMALSETPFAFFVAVSLYFVSQARKKDGNWHHALLAGLSLTLAAHIRYEGWILIPLFGILLWKKTKILVVFLTASLISPMFWLLGSYIHYGNALYSIEYQYQDTQATLGGKLKEQLLKRILFVPGGLFLGMSIFVNIIAVWGAILSLIKRKYNSVWLIPFLGICFILFFKSVTGSLTIFYKYLILPGMLLLPFCAETINTLNIFQRKKYLKYLILLSMIPISFFCPFSFKAIPRISQEIQAISLTINQYLNKQEDRLILVGLGWAEKQQVAFQTQLKYDKIVLSFGLNPTDNIDIGWDMDKKRKTLKEFLNDGFNPGGIIVFDQTNLSKNATQFIETGELKINGAKLKKIKKLGDEGNTVIYRYQFIPPISQ